jgi:hypothetical protein
MNTQNPHFDLMADLDSRHDDLMLKLDELDRRVEQALVQCQQYRVGEGRRGGSGLTPPRDR